VALLEQQAKVIVVEMLQLLTVDHTQVETCLVQAAVEQEQ
jgi:hypothetical protein